MSFHGRSLDDLPLAAYSTGMIEDEPDEEPEPGAVEPPMDARAAALSIVASPAAVAPSTEPPTVASAPRVVEPPSRTPGDASEAIGPRLAHRLNLPRDARTAARDPRVLAAGGIVLGALLLAGVFGRGLTAGLSGPGSTASPPPATATQPPAAVTFTLSGAVTGDYSFTGSSGLGRPADGHIASTWADALGNSLTMTGQASQGTQPTSPDLVLSWTVVVKGAPVTFTSQAGECVVGMALKPATVSGSIVCEKLRSDDGSLVVKLIGSYRT